MISHQELEFYMFFYFLVWNSTQVNQTIFLSADPAGPQGHYIFLSLHIKMQFLAPHPKPIKSDLLEWSRGVWIVNKLPHRTILLPPL